MDNKRSFILGIALATLLGTAGIAGFVTAPDPRPAPIKAVVTTTTQAPVTTATTAKQTAPKAGQKPSVPITKPVPIVTAAPKSVTTTSTTIGPPRSSELEARIPDAESDTADTTEHMTRDKAVSTTAVVSTTATTKP